MLSLSNRVYQYYLDNFDALGLEKKFHFASRLYLWDRDEGTADKLADLKAEFTCGDQPGEALEKVVNKTLSNPLLGSKNASEIRTPYFKKYPLLKPCLAALFRITFLKAVYNHDVRQDFFKYFPRTETDELAKQLLSDAKATAILSTHAVNYLYLYSRMLLDNSSFDPAYFLKLGHSCYDESDPIQVQLKIYLYTHCIIGESKFYQQPVQQTNAYQQMLTELESLIGNNFQKINLDNKFEFLVCARQMGHKSRLEEQIYAEAEASLSDRGTFLIDRHNDNPQVDNTDLPKSEHRNVLFIMSTRDYQPLY